MSVDSVLDEMAEVHFGEWVQTVAPLAARSGYQVSEIGYDTLPDAERRMRREVMRSALIVAVRAIDDEVLVDAMNAGDIEMHQAADLSQRLDQWLDN